MEMNFLYFNSFSALEPDHFQRFSVQFASFVFFFFFFVKVIHTVTFFNFLGGLLNKIHDLISQSRTWFNSVVEIKDVFWTHLALVNMTISTEYI